MPPILDVAIGTIFVFLLFSLVVSVLNEVILSKFDQRAKFLHLGLQELFGEAAKAKNQKWGSKFIAWISGGLLSRNQIGVLTARLYQHGLINAFWRTDSKIGSSPSYIPAGAFVIALLDMISRPEKLVPPESPVTKNLLRRALDAIRQPIAGTYNSVVSYFRRDSAPEVAKMVSAFKEIINSLPAETRVRVQNLKEQLDDPSKQNGDALLAIATQLATELKRVVDSPAGGDETKQTAANIEQWIEDNLKNFPYLQESLRSLFINVDKDVGKFKTAVEGWFNDSMERVSGWYKRFAQKWMIVIGFLLAAFFNVDTVHIVEVLSKSPNLAKAVASQAEAYVQQNKLPQANDAAAALTEVQSAQADLKKAQQGADQSAIAVAQKRLDSANEAADPEAKFHAAIAKLSDTGIPIGWDESQLKALDLERKQFTLDNIWSSIWHPGPWNAVTRGYDWFSAHLAVLASLIAGWFLTALAASLGAPFWFDTLSRIMNVRNAGGVPGEKDPKSTATKAPATLN